MSKCPRCHAPAYVGFTAVECPTEGCANYSAKEAAARATEAAQRYVYVWTPPVADKSRLLGGRIKFTA